MTAPTKEDVERAERVIDNQTSGEEISCGPDGVDITDGLIMGIAQLLADERERVWRKAAGTVLPNPNAVDSWYDAAICLRNAALVDGVDLNAKSE